MAVVTVSQLNNYMKRYVENNVHLTNLYVKGEISNYKKHYSGHIYLTLKDEGSCIKAVMFKHCVSSLKFDIQNGMCVIAFGKVSVYERDGQYQLYIDSMTPDGVGELYVAYEQLKAKLESEGLFDNVHKKPIPRYPKSIGVVTSPTGAAVRDIINVIKRRYRLADIYIYPAQVQGIGAGQSVADGIRFFNKNKNVDVIIAGRGGGSIEDLWAFNEEVVARSIFDSYIPVISAVGHETDFTIADFVADLRVPTPSAAAEMAVPNEMELRSSLQMTSGRLLTLLSHLCRMKRNKYEQLISNKVFKDFSSVINDKKLLIDTLTKDYVSLCEKIITKEKHRYINVASKLEAMNPMSVLNRGYSIALNNGKTVKSIEQIGIGDELKLVFSDGKIKCRVVEKENNNG